MSLLSAYLLWFVFLIILSAFFSSAEVAYTGLSLNQMKRIKRAHPQGLDLWEKNPDQILATLLLSNNAVNIAVGVLAASFSLDLADEIGWKKSLVTFLTSFLSSLVLLFFGEIIPKLWANRFNVSWALWVTPLINFWTRLLSPITKAAVRLTNLILLGYPKRHRSSLFLESEELKAILRNSVIPLGSRKIMNNVMTFSKSRVDDVMIPREEIFSVSSQESLATIIEKVVQSGLSRIPVFHKTLDNILGVLYSKDLLVAWRSGTLVVLEDLLRPVLFVQKHMLLPDLLRIFKTGRRHLAVVVDKEASKEMVSGLVTLQDALEAIVGDIKEEE